MNTIKSQVKNSLQPEIYIADLSAYNHGYLHGEWVDPTQGKEVLLEEINRILSCSPVLEIYPDEAVEEFAIHDYSDFYEAELGEYPDLDEVVETACFLLKHGRLGAALIGYCSNLEEAQKAMEENYCGQFESVEDYAYELLNDQITLPSFLEYYLNYKAYARDLELNGDIFTIKLRFQEVHIFWRL